MEQVDKKKVKKALESTVEGIWKDIRVSKNKEACETK